MDLGDGNKRFKKKVLFFCEINSFILVESDMDQGYLGELFMIKLYSYRKDYVN